jgi:hypothetical protein
MRMRPGDVGLSPFFTVNWTKAEQGCQMAYFQTKNTYLGKFWGSCNGKCWYIIWPFGLHIVPLFDIFVAIWHIFLVLVCSIKKNLATLRPRPVCKSSHKSSSFFCRRPARKKVTRLKNVVRLVLKLSMISFDCRASPWVIASSFATVWHADQCDQMG